VISRSISSSMEAYAVGVRGWACEVPEQVNVHVVSDSSGPIERTLETLPALASNGSRFRKRIGSDARCALSASYLTKNSSASRSGNARIACCERSQMQVNGDRPYSAEHVADDFLDAYGQRLSQEAVWLRERILTYVDTKVAFRRR